MSKISVVYWSQTGNTQAMAEAVAEGIKGAGAEAELLEVGAASVDALKAEKAFALGWVLKFLKRVRWSHL